VGVVSTPLTAGRPPAALLGETPAVTQTHRILYQAWCDANLRRATLLAVHSALCAEPTAFPGQLRQGNVVVRLHGELRFRAPHVSRVATRLDLLMNWLECRLHTAAATAFPVDLAASFSWQLSNIHPFQDGNGRVARTVSSWIIATCGYGVVRPRDLRRFLYVDAVRYYDALGANDVGDPDPWHHLFDEAVGSCLLTPDAYRAPIAGSSPSVPLLD